MMTHDGRTTSDSYGASAYYRAGSSVGNQGRIIHCDINGGRSHQAATYSYHPLSSSSSSSLAGALGPVQPRESILMETMPPSTGILDDERTPSRGPVSSHTPVMASSSHAQSTELGTSVPAFTPSFGNSSNPLFNATVMYETSWIPSADQTYQHAMTQNFSMHQPPFRPDSAGRQPLSMGATFTGSAPDLLYGSDIGMFPFMTGFNQWEIAPDDAAFSNPDLIANFQPSAPWPPLPEEAHASSGQTLSLPIMIRESASAQANEIFASANIQPHANASWCSVYPAKFGQQLQAGYVGIFFGSP